MNTIRRYRLAAKLKQSELGQKLRVGGNTISNWETGYSEPDIASLNAMADLFDCTVDDLLGREKTPAVEQNGERTILDITQLTPENRDRLEDYLNLLLNSQNS